MKASGMKQSEKYLRGSIVGICVFLFLNVVYSRMVPDTELAQQPRQPTAEALAALRDFSRIDAAGDFVLEIRQQDTFSVEYTPGNGVLRADVDNGTLELEGYGNGLDGKGVLRVGLPVLAQLQLEGPLRATVAGFTAAELPIVAALPTLLRLENNDVGTLRLDLRAVRVLELHGNRFGTREFTMQAGETRVVETE